ncbi:MAG: MBL fold metallo-hydrolase [Myxococcota bacterium]
MFALATLTALLVAGLGLMATELRDVGGQARVEVAPGIVAVATGKSYAYVLRGDTGVVLVDAGSDSDARGILEELARTKQSAADIHAVFITSPHPFTVAGLDALRDAPVYLGEGDEALVRGSSVVRAPIARLWSRLHARKKRDNPLQPVLAGARIVIDGIAIEAVATPGVSNGGRSYITRETAFVGPAFAMHDGKLATPSFWLVDHREHLRVTLQRLGGHAFGAIAGSTFTPHGDGHALYLAWEANIPESERLPKP